MESIFDRWCSSYNIFRDIFVIVIIGIFFIVIGYRPPWWRRKNNALLNYKEKIIKTISDIPGPYALPILGTRWIYTWFGAYRLEKVHECYEDLFRKYGEIIREQALWNIPVISVKKRQDIETVLKQNGKYPLRPPTEVISHYRTTRPDRYASVGLVNEQGFAWYQLRSALTPALVSAKTITQFVPALNEIVDDFISLMRRMRNENNTVAKLEKLTNRMGLESSCALILGKRMGFLDNNVDKTAALLETAVQDHFCASRDTFYGLPFWKLYKTRAYKKLIKSEDTIYNIISELVDTALSEQLDTCDIDGGVQSVFMSMLQAHNVDIREKKATIIDFIAAGIQTLGNTLVFLLHLIGKHPHVQNKLHTELTQLLGSNTQIDSVILNKATYLRACIDECFRILPTANCIARILDSDEILSDYSVPAGSVILCHTGLACLEDSNFPDAHTYRPERWLEDSEETNLAARYLVVPFGIGRRICPGKRFIRQELQLVLAKIVKEFHIIRKDELELQFEFLISPQGPVDINLEDRY